MARASRVRRVGRGLPALLALAVLALAGCTSGGGAESAEETYPLPETTPFAPDVQTRLHEIRDRAASLRGLPVHPSVVEGTLSRDDFIGYVEETEGELTAAERRELEASNIALRLMHVLSHDEDLWESYIESFGEDVLGLYFFEEDHLVLIGDPAALGEEDEVVLAHEYAHSFQDASLDQSGWDRLLALEDKGAATEYEVTLTCLKEGDATVLQWQYAEDVFGPDWTGESDEGVGSIEEEEPYRSTALDRYGSFDYWECQIFAYLLHEEGGWAAVDAAYADPPSTTEQVLHLEKYEAREAALPLEVPDLHRGIGASWELFDRWTFGEFDTFVYLVTVLSHADLASVARQQALGVRDAEPEPYDVMLATQAEYAASEAAEGWGAGWATTYRKVTDKPDAEQDIVVHIALSWDTDEDYQEFLQIYGEVIRVVAREGYEIADRVTGPIRWTGVDEYGYVTWDDDERRVDVLIATSAPVRDSAAQVLEDGLASGR